MEFTLQIIYGKVNVSVPSPPPYKRQVWDYSEANKEEIRNTLLSTDWSFEFSDLTGDEMTSVFTKLVMDIMHRFIPNKTIKCNDKDPPWITPEIKTAIKCKHRVYNKYVRRGRKPDECEYVRVTRNETSKIITGAKETYFASLGRKLSNPKIGLKVYWSTLNKIINKKKMTNIPPLLENGIFVTNFQTKADIFNDLFVQQCSVHVNESVLPNFISRCNLSLANIDIDPDKVLEIIRSLDCNKAHGWDNLSVAMIKICDVGIVKPLCLIYNQCLASGTFPEIWKKGNVIPVHKKESRQLKKNYRPISLLPICGKIFEKIIFDVIYKHLMDNDLLTPNQSGFRPGDSTINQLLYITHKISTAFEDYPSRETRAVFLDISKAFDKVWHNGLIFKLESYGISGPLLALINSYLANRYQRVVLNGKCSKWSPVTAGVPQGSVLGPLLFLVYINDLVDNISSDAKLFADDTSLFTVVYDENIATEQLNRDLKIIADWAYQWKMQFNPDITKQAIQVIFSQKRDKPIHPPIYFNESEVVIKQEQKHLGLILDSSLNFQSHVREKIVSARRGIGVIRYMSRYVTRDVLDQMYKLYIRPHLDYGDIIYHKYDPEMNLDFTKKLEATQYTAALAVSGAWRGTNKYKLYEELGWESLYHGRWYRRLTHFFKLKNRCSPLYLYDLIPPEREIHYDLRAPRDYVPQIERTVRFSNTYFQNCIHEWNLLDVSTRSIQSISQFKTELLGRIRPPKRPKIINKKKMTNIPPLLENGIFVANFQTKADIFNDLFVQQCSVHVNESVLPNFISRCNLSLANIDIDPDKVLEIIRSLDCNKAHGWDNLSVAMIKICDVGIVKPLCLIYNQCLASGTFPEIWKKGNVIPVHKKESRQLKKNYRPISLLPICGKIFEKIIFDVIYKHLMDNDLLTPNQSGFRPGDSTINQLLYITHKIFTAFEDYPSRETRAVFLDISKAFDKVWHNGLIFKLEYRRNQAPY